MNVQQMTDTQRDTNNKFYIIRVKVIYREKLCEYIIKALTSTLSRGSPVVCNPFSRILGVWFGKPLLGVGKAIYQIIFITSVLK